MLQFVMRLIPPWGWAGLLAVALASAGAWHLNATHQARKEGRAEVQQRWDAERMAQLELARKTEAQYRAKEQADAEKLAQVQQDWEKRHAQITADADRARRAAGGLRSALDIATGAIRRGTAQAPATAAECASAADAAGVLAELFGRADARAGVLAAAADDAHAAGAACERADEVTR